MTDGYETSIEQVRQHGTNLTHIADQLDPALEAANAQSIPEDAFGVICNEIGISGWLVQPLHDRGVQSVTNAIARAEEIKDILTAVARTYDQQELRKASGFNEQSGKL